MARKIDIKTLIKNNRSVDAKQLAEVRKMLKTLREHGVKGAEYNILTPFTRRHIHKAEHLEEDPRTVHLRR
jgi:hypothetical protein